MRGERRRAFGLDFVGALASGPAGWLRESGSRLPQSKSILEKRIDSGILACSFPLIMEDLPDDEKCAKGTQHWPHAPPHRLSLGGVYFVTARSAGGRHLLADDDMKDWFQETLFTITQEFGWTLEAWAILSNHYHIIGHSPKGPDGAESLRQMIRKLHSLTTQQLNYRENQPGRTRLWQNFRETCLTHQRSYLARLHYVHQNAVHHKLVALGSDWKWCSAAEFKKAVTPAWLKTITSFRYDEIAEKDHDDL
jgi:putative transposase